VTDDPAILQVTGSQPVFSVLQVQAYRGPNLYSRRPVIRIRIDLGVLEDWPSNRIPGFNGALLDALGGLAGHGCSCPERGGFAARLADGTWLGHVIEHVALELQTLAGSPVSRGKTRSVAGQRGVYDILFRYEDEPLGLAAGAQAIRLVLSLLPAELGSWSGERLLPPALSADPRDIPAVVVGLERIFARGRLGPTTDAIVRAARRRAIPANRLDRQSHVQLGWGSRQKRVRASITSETSHIGVGQAGNKDVTKSILQDLGLPVPRGKLVRSAEEALAAARALTVPVAIKPLDGNHGRGVSTDLRSDAQIVAAYQAAAKISPSVIVEQHLPGRDHRILLVDGKVVAVAERAPASVVGDGFHTIGQLIDLLNEDPRRGEGHEKVLTRIKVDRALEDMLERQGRRLESVPLAGETVRLRGTANLSSGGTSTDRTDDIHPHNRLIAEMAARAIGLDIAGIDFMSPDISRPVNETGGGIVEINAAPGFRMHLAPSGGQARDVAGPVIDMLFPRGTPSRIPLVAVTGTNGKSTTVRMISQILRASGLRLGLTNTSGVYVDDVLLKAGDASGPRSAAMVLRNPAVDAAVLETARGGILREGLGFDSCSVGVVLNVSEDHLGIKGVNSLKELAAIKAVVVSSVARRGAAVLNFDDPLTRAMARKARGRVIWFSLSAGADDPALAAHLLAGGSAVLREQDEIVLWEGRSSTFVASVAAIPATAGGLASFNVDNALAATAAAVGLGIEPAAIARALTGFRSDFADNPGRFNIIDNHPFRIVIDYAHNPASMRAMGACLAQMRRGGGRLIGMVSIPGDRRDDDAREIGRIAATIFDHIIFREGPDGRGRQRGEVLTLLEAGAAETAATRSITFESILEESDAVARCLSLGRSGDLVALFPTQIEAVHRQVHMFEAREGERHVSV
jgi:cyanophycin synthetase